MCNAYAGGGLSRVLRRLATGGALAGVCLLGAPALASADNSTMLTVVGTSDVSDSGLMPNVIQPAFQSAYPQFNFRYVGSATGTAIQSAENGGASGPSVLIVHAASLENQFVANGYSYDNQYGNAIFRNDFVLAGPATNESAKANVGANAANSIAQAFADIASAGAANDATFISRGGATTASGTTVEEHAIWQLAFQNNLLPADVYVCTVSAADGGGMSPINIPQDNDQPCPDNGTVNPMGTGANDNPSWYQIDNVSQATALQATNSCTVGNKNGSCYMLTDRGTFDYLSNGGTASGGPSTIPNLAIVTRDNSASAPGGRYALLNYFHAYIINPNKPNENVNLTAAQDFVNLLTSPSLQTAVSQYLAGTSDPGGAPFVPDASPIITAAGLPSTVTAGQPVTVSGNVANAEVGYPTLSGEPVQVDEVAGGLVIPISGASANTDNNGNYSITFTPPSSGSYQVVTSTISQVENPSLSPIYGDLLVPGASAATAVSVETPKTPANATVLLKSVRAGQGAVRVAGRISPATPDANAQITLLARKQGAKGGYTVIKSGSLKSGAGGYHMTAQLPAGRFQIEVTYSDPGTVTTATSRAVKLTVLNTATMAGFVRERASHGRVAIRGRLSQAAPSAATVELLGTRTARTSGGALAASRFRVLARIRLKAGRRSFSVERRLTRGYRYSFQLAYLQRGRTTTYSRVASLSVR